MTLYYPGPFEVRIGYTVTIGSLPINHVQRLNCDVTSNPAPGTAFSAITVTKQGGGTQNLNTAVDNWVLKLKAKYNGADCTITHAELWKYVANSFIASFISDYVINVTGTAGGGTMLAGQGIYTFRTVQGHTMKVSLMEPVLTPAAPVVYTNLFTADKDIVDRILASDNSWIARDNSFPFAFLRYFPGENEAIFKKRLR